MTVRRALALITLVAALHGGFYIWYQRPDWFTTWTWTDQAGYRKLGAMLATEGRFTRYDTSEYVPEAIRTPGYPLFVAAVYRVAGQEQLPVTIAQTIVFVLICWMVFLLGRDIAGERLALAAAALTALYSPIPYFAALVVTEVWATFLFTLSMWLCVRARAARGTWPFVLAGAATAATALTRPAFALFPFLLFGTSAVVFHRERRTGRWAAALVAAVVLIAPWIAYNYSYFHRLTISPANGLGRAVWEGSWQGRWEGRVQSTLTDIADRTPDRAALDERVRELAAGRASNAEPMLTYVHQWQDIRRIWTEPVEPWDRVNARMRADTEYMRTGIENMRQDPVGHVGRRLTRGLFVLWAAEIPVRYSDINTLSTLVIRAIWAVQAVLFALALWGVAALARRGLWREACVLATPIVYVTAVHLPLLTEARQSLPAQPTLLLLATCGAADLLHRFTPAGGPAPTGAPV
jgi:4-amino-4-deoxy-L-arabinose transferase-like glycosyltransferase